MLSDSIVFVNPHKDNSGKKVILCGETEQEKLEDRIVAKVLSHLALTLDVRDAIKQIEKLNKELDIFEKRFN